MRWPETILLAVVLFAAGLYALLGIAIIVTALVERRSLRFLVQPDPDDPERRRLNAIESLAESSQLPESDSNPYAAPRTAPYAERQIVAASRLRFSPLLLYKHGKGGIYKTYNVLTVSPSRQSLAVIKWGTTASIRNEGTSLYSALDDGRYLITSDRPTGSRAPGLYDDLVLWGATFAQLLGRHEERMRASGKKVKELSAEKPLAEYESILERRARLLVERGEACWVDPAQTAFRSTIKGALKLYAQTFSTKHVDRSLSTAGR
jgi:hypothetical protein